MSEHEEDFRAAIARALGVPDGGQYLNDFLTRIQALRRFEAFVAEAATHRYGCCGDMYHTGPCLHERARQLVEPPAHTEESG